MWAHFYFFSNWAASWYEMHLPPSYNSELVCHAPPSPMVTACHLFTRLNASWRLWTKHHKVCTWRCAAVLHWVLLPALFMSTVGLQSVSCFCIIKNVWCSWATGNTNRATASCLLEMHFFFLLRGWFSLAPFTRSTHISCIHPPQTHSRLHLKGEQSELRLETRLRLSALS